MKLLISGSFDPITLGHIDIIKRAYAMSTDLMICIATNPDKKHMFDDHTRVDMISDAIDDMLPNKGRGIELRAVPAGTLLVDFLSREGITHSVRGLRSANDMDYEINLHRTNQMLGAPWDLVTLVTDPAYANVSSSLVRSLLSFDWRVTAKPIRNIVPNNVADRIFG